jgi:hypothetical protein
MIIKKISILLFCLVISYLQAYCLEKTDTLYKITSIKSKDSIYIIIARRNDSLFKIISIKSLTKSNYEQLKRGGYYNFNFNNSNQKISDEKIKPLSGIANYSDIENKSVFIIGDIKIKFTKRFHYRLYMTKNLIGLYYIPDSP